MTKKITLESLSNQIAKASDQMAKGFAVVAEEIVEVREDIADLSRRVGSLEKGQEEILKELKPLSRAHDKDSETILDHGKRIIRIEKHIGVK